MTSDTGEKLVLIAGSALRTLALFVGAYERIASRQLRCS
jgi:hypothetical protein